jgi:hypothetical protein
MQAMLLALRLTIFAFFVAAVIHVFRRFDVRDRRIGVAMGWAAGVTGVGALAILAESWVSAEPLAIGALALKLFILLSLTGVLWVAIYSGLQLGEQQGGYWTKTCTTLRAASLWSGAAVLGLLAGNLACWRVFASTLNLAPSGEAILPVVLSHLSYSLGEEFFYRGCVQALLVFWLGRIPGGKWWAVIIATGVFTAQHTFAPTQLLLAVYPAGVVFGLVFARFGIWAAVATHFAANLVMSFVLPRLV